VTKYLRTRRDGHVFTYGAVRIEWDEDTMVSDADADTITTAASLAGVILTVSDTPDGNDPVTPADPSTFPATRGDITAALAGVVRKVAYPTQADAEAGLAANEFGDGDIVMITGSTP